MAGKAEIEIEMRMGTQRDAIKFSLGVNGAHGLRRTNEDKERAVKRALEDSEWCNWSDTHIAVVCAVSQPFVSKLRQQLSNNGYEIPAERTVTRNGTTYTQNTANIGKPRQPEPTIEDVQDGKTADTAYQEYLDNPQSVPVEKTEAADGS